MFDKYSYKTKLRVLPVIFCMLAIAAYRRSFHPLADLVRENNELTERAAKLSQGTPDLDALAAEVKALDRIIGKGGLSKEKIQQDILSFISQYNSVSIFNLEAIHSFSDASYNVYTNQIDVTGNFDQLLALSYDLEKKADYSKIISLNFYTTKKNNKADILHLKMIFQSYENKN